MKVPPAPPPAMLQDLSASRVDAPVDAEVCIVGTGPAGLTLARALAEQGVRAVMLERGAVETGRDLPPLDIGFGRRPYRGATAGRRFGWGGTSALWGGQLLPLRPHDMGPRAAHAVPGWPIDHTELEVHQARLEHWLGVSQGPFEQLGVDDRCHPLAGLDLGGFVPRFSKWIPFRRRHLGQAWGAHLESAGVRVWTQAEVFRFRAVADESPGFGEGPSGLRRVTEVTARSPNGHRLVVRASHVVLAAGALESAALALLLQEQGGLGPSNGASFLGRHLHDHLSLRIARVRVRDRRRFNELFAPVFEGGTMRTLRLEWRSLPATVGALPPLYAHFVGVVPEGSGVATLRDLLRALQRHDLAQAGRQALELPRGLLDITKLAYWRILRRRLVLPAGSELHLHVDFEQPADGGNRVRLTPPRPGDPTRSLLIDWDLGVDLKPIVDQMGQALRDLWQRNGLDEVATLEFEPADAVAQATPANVHDIFHPAGTTRMAYDERQGAVSPHLRLFGSSNVHVLSSSVFPSMGTANPTFTLMLLALRLAGHLLPARTRAYGSPP